MTDSILVVQPDGSVKAVFKGDVEATSFSLPQDIEGPPPKPSLASAIRWLASGEMREQIFGASREFFLSPKVKTAFRTLMAQAGGEQRALVNDLGGSSFLQLSELHVPEPPFGGGHYQAPAMAVSVGEARVAFDGGESEGEVETVEHDLGRVPQFIGVFAEVAAGYVIAFDYHIVYRDPFYFQFEPVASTPVPGPINVTGLWIAIG